MAINGTDDVKSRARNQSYFIIKAKLGSPLFTLQPPFPAVLVQVLLFSMFCVAMTRPQKDRTKHCLYKPLMFHLLHLCSLPTAQQRCSEPEITSLLAGIRDAASSRNCWPSLLGCYMKLLEVSITAQVTGGFSQPPCSCSSVSWAQSAQTGD